jgi:hypothetical protein
MVVSQQDSSMGMYVLSVFQHASHLRFGTHDEAIREATAFAAQHQVDAWSTNDGGKTYVRIAAYR